MPCNGIAVLSARVKIDDMAGVPIDWIILKNELQRQGFSLATERTNAVLYGRRYNYLKMGSGVSVTVYQDGGGEVKGPLYNQNIIDKVTAVVQLASGLTLQQRMVAELKARNATILNAKTTKNGALVMSVKLNGLKCRVVVALSGDISVITEEGDFITGKKMLESLLDELRARGLNIKAASQIEQHRHTHEHAHAHAGQRDRNRRR